MTEKTNDGGPAFPCPQDPINQNVPSLGMTLRDYFAAKAMQGMAAGDAAQSVDFATSYLELIGTQAYQIADAMLAARSAS